MRDSVGGDEVGPGGGRRGFELDLVVGRPGDTGGGRLQEQRGDHRGEGDAVQQAVPASAEDQQGHGGDYAPHHGGGAEPRQYGEGDRADDAAEQVVAVGVERGELAEEIGGDLADPGHDQCGQQEDRGQRHPLGQAGGLHGREVDDLAAALTHLHRVGADEDDEKREGDRCPAFEPLAASGRDQESDTDAEERPQQDEVGEVAEVDDVGARPSDQRQLHEEHGGAGQHQPPAHRANCLSAFVHLHEGLRCQF